MAYANNSRRRPGGSPTRRAPGVQSFRPRPQRNKRSNGSQYIHPSKFVNKAVEKKDEIVYQPKHKFVDFPFSEMLQNNIYAKGYVNPSAIQDQAIPAVLDGRDVIGLANTGTGKTAAFLLPLIQNMERGTFRPSILIMAPTRELAQQIDVEFRAFSAGMKLYSTVVVGGTNMDRQIRELKRHPHVVIGTPGRLKDLLNRRVLNLETVKALVLDEADRMLDMGFMTDIKTIVSQMPKDRQTLFFSATITPDIERVINDFLKDPVTVSVRTSETADHVEQTVIEARDKDHKYDLLADLLSREDYSKVLVFSDTKFGAQRLSDRLAKENVATSVAIHGNKSQSQRQRALKQFRDEQVRVLVATDVAARGLDIPNVTHVINFDQPKTYEDYVHRIGRTGRGGASGTAHTFVTK